MQNSDQCIDAPYTWTLQYAAIFHFLFMLSSSVCMCAETHQQQQSHDNNLYASVLCTLILDKAIYGKEKKIPNSTLCIYGFILKETKRFERFFLSSFQSLSLVRCILLKLCSWTERFSGCFLISWLTCNSNKFQDRSKCSAFISGKCHVELKCIKSPGLIVDIYSRLYHMPVKFVFL